MDKILKGYQYFKTNVFDQQKDFFEQIANKQQHPRALFITCADSRVNPNLLTQTEPGDLFLLRNAGNIVPPYGAASGGEGATIEYALSVLGIRNIILCGHSHCGAMQALLDDDAVRNYPATAAWFAHARSTRRIVEAKHANLDKDEKLTAAVCENVLVQLNNLRTHPSVAEALARDQLNLYAWVYIIETGELLSFDPAQARFSSLSTHAPVAIAAEPHLEGDPTE